MSSCEPRWVRTASSAPGMTRGRTRPTGRARSSVGSRRRGLDPPATGSLSVGVGRHDDWSQPLIHPDGRSTTMSEQKFPTLAGVVSEHLRAVNAFDEDAIVATFCRRPRQRRPAGVLGH